jgi:hypothetical protein
MKRTILLFIFMAAAAILAAAQPKAERERISHDDYREAIDAAHGHAEDSSERRTSVYKDYFERTLTKIVTDVFERLPGGRYRWLTVTEENGRVTEREERVVVGKKDYHRINNGRWKKTPPAILTISERPSVSPPIVKDEYLRLRPEKAGEPDVYTWEHLVTWDGVAEMTVYKYSIVDGLITAFEYTNWEKTSENITRTETRKYEHGIRDIKITLPVLTRRKRG